MTQTSGTEHYGFQAEVKQLLQLMIHSLYSNKEIFLRELISNASDAADKLRFKALSDSNLLADDASLRVRISIDKDARTITISDNGIGMTHDDVVSHLGTIAKSGTKEFFGQLTGDQAKDSQLIGQFGVGFYSGFIVADRISVRTRAASVSADDAVEWQSAGEGEYQVTPIHKSSRGTDVILHLRDGEDEFLNDWQLRSLITKYSDHISIPVEMLKEVTVESDDGEEGEKTTATEWEAVNKATALWTRAKADLNDEEYEEFYQHVSHDFETPLTWAHNQVEGANEYISLLYVPKRAPWDLWNRERPRGVKLYVKRVFIMDDAEQFMPLYLRFVKGVLDSADLPLNVSREILQDSRQTKQLRGALTKRALQMLQKLAKDDAEKYQIFWNEFGQVLKEGPAEDVSNKEKIAKLLRFASTHNSDATQNVSFDDYIARMKETQKDIYYVLADSYSAAKSSPQIEKLVSNGVEVLLLSDRIDDWMLSYLDSYDEKSLVNVAKADIDFEALGIEDDKAAREAADKALEPVLDRVKQALGDSVSGVSFSQRLAATPSCVVTDANGMSSQMLKLMQATGQHVPEQKYALELNSQHELVKALLNEQDETRFADWAQMLYEQALLAERGALEDPNAFISRINKLLQK